MLSRKLFCYTQESDNGNQLLETFRKRMGGPTTHVPLDQSVTVFDSAVSCLSRDEVSDSDSQKTRMLLHTEWPGGADRATWSNVQFKNEQAESSRSGSVAKASSKATKAKAAAAKAKAAPLDSLEFAVYANQQSRSWNEKDWEVAAAVTDSASSTMVVPRSAWIQLGGSDKSSKGVGALGTGARETYVYRSSLDENDETTTTVRYTRYGEAPVWYGPGRFCQLELTGRRLLLPDRQQNGDDDNANLFAELRPYVPVAAHVIQQHLPRFCKFGLPLTSRPKKLPLPARGRRQKRVQGKDDDDPVFAYYAKALHSALTDEAIDTSDTMATLYSSGTSADQMTCADYRRFYHDLAVGRYMHRFCQARPGNDRNGYQQDFLHSLPYHHHDDPDGLNTATTRTQRARRQQLYRMLQTGAFKLQYYWNKFRSATSISIGEF
jgi:hypothetical protein